MSAVREIRGIVLALKELRRVEVNRRYPTQLFEDLKQNTNQNRSLRVLRKLTLGDLGLKEELVLAEFVISDRNTSFSVDESQGRVSLVFALLSDIRYRSAVAIYSGKEEDLEEGDDAREEGDYLPIRVRRVDVTSGFRKGETQKSRD